MLWTSSDDGKIWSDTGGRTAGRHSTVVPLKDGSFLAMGGKSTNIEGYMPQAISHDGGKTWAASRTIFASLGANQRPTLIRLASGRLFFAGDFQDFDGNSPPGIKERGAYVALSEDEGKTWTVKPLPQVEPHESQVIKRSFGGKDWVRSKNENGTLGYAVARQGQNGMIHLITTMNHPALHFELNEAWISDRSAGPNTEIDAAATGSRVSEQESPSRTARSRWQSYVGKDGRYLLDGPFRSAYPSGSKQYEVVYSAGSKVGTEKLYAPDGRLIWSREHKAGGSVWTHYWSNGRPKSESTWKGVFCHGQARQWDRNGKLVATFTFEQGELVR